jgi:hypothetical protein
MVLSRATLRDLGIAELSQPAQKDDFFQSVDGPAHAAWVATTERALENTRARKARVLVCGEPAAHRLYFKTLRGMDLDVYMTDAAFAPGVTSSEEAHYYDDETGRTLAHRLFHARLDPARPGRIDAEDEARPAVFDRIVAKRLNGAGSEEKAAAFFRFVLASLRGRDSVAYLQEDAAPLGEAYARVAERFQADCCADGKARIEFVPSRDGSGVAGFKITKLI